MAWLSKRWFSTEIQACLAKVPMMLIISLLNPSFTSLIRMMRARIDLLTNKGTTNADLKLESESRIACGCWAAAVRAGTQV